MSDLNALNSLLDGNTTEPPVEEPVVEEPVVEIGRAHV